MENKVLNAQEILGEIKLNSTNEYSKTQIELSTLQEVGDGCSHEITVDRIVFLEKLGLTIILDYFVGIENANAPLEIKMRATGLDPNTENTALSIKSKDKSLEIIYDGEIYNCDELSELNAFHNEILNSEINNLTTKIIDDILKKLP